ncbi:GntR family transcriptional regulator [Streptomyces tuirus]
MARTTPHDPPPTEAEPLYRRIATELLAELRDGTIPPGERLPSERRLAGHLGVSRETVRQSLELLRRDGLVTTDRRGSHATLPGLPVETPASLTFPVGADPAAPGGVARATVTWEAPSPDHAEALGLEPGRPTLIHRYRYATTDGQGLRSAVTSFSAVALAEVEELALPHCLNGVGGAPIRDRADGTAAAQLRRAYDWMRRAGLTLHHRDAISRLASVPSVRVTRQVHDQYARPLEITDLVVDAQREALVYEFTLPSRAAAHPSDRRASPVRRTADAGSRR